MEKKLSKKQIKMIATIHSATNLSTVDMYMFEQDTTVPYEQRFEILKEIQLIAEKLSKNEAMNLGSTSEIVEYVRRKF